MAGNSKWRRFLNTFHIYGGLLTTGFLITFSFSAIQHQHHFILPKSERVKHWSKEFNIPQVKDHLEFKLAVRDSLALFGHAPWWEDYTDSLGVDHFMIARPGKKYWVTVPRDNNIFNVAESRTSILEVLNAMHPLAAGMMNVGEKPPFILAWRIMAECLALVLLAVLIVSVHFWFTRSLKDYRSWIIVSLFASFALILIFSIWLVG